ncbi:MAG TPA: membrane protein insertase YidC [Candidatus Limnocylindria bacterium]|nr:membrane protein insertase YidC [Candidatus Limnocylindria bacterium]
MERRTLIVVLACLALMFAYPFLLKSFGLDRYLRRTPPPPAAVDTARVTGATDAPVSDTAAPIAPPVPSAQLGAVPVRAAQAELERTLHIDTPLYRAEFSNRGARLVAVELKRYAAAHGTERPARPDRNAEVPAADRVVLAGGPSLALDLGAGGARRSLADAAYAVQESLDAAGMTRSLTFTLRDAEGLFVRQTFRVRPDGYALDLDVEIRGVPAGWRVADYSLTARSWPLVNESNAMDDARSLRATSLVGTNLHREGMGGIKRAPRVFDGAATLAAVQTRYFVGAVAVAQATGRSVISQSEVRRLDPGLLGRMPQGSPVTQEVAVNTLVVGLPGETNPLNRFVVYFGPGEYIRLARLGHGLDRLVDLGWAWITPFSKALLQLLVWLHGLLKNYGVAIVLLATLVRVALHPLNMMSMKSMRSMQRLQPEMERIKVKYKNDPQAMNTAVMALYKENKVNPAGGCLPILLQMPLFIALYSVLFNAIELRQAPFAAWIQDLSAPDHLFSIGPFPIRVLPLVMTGSGLLSQKLTPTDPRQAPTMYLMNVMMLVFFYNLPSGLVLYWTVMNLLTALQQWMVLRDDGPAAPAPALAASARPVAKKASGK